MATIESASSIPPLGSPLPALREAAAACHACPLWRRATQTVFGEGPVRAPLLLVGEQPGDEEDRAGHPFVGPAGRLLSRALEEAGVDRAQAFVTNAVKHFKWTMPERGKRRIHEKPNAAEVRACNPWLLDEIAAVEPRVIVCLGATAAQALLPRLPRDRAPRRSHRVGRTAADRADGAPRVDPARPRRGDATKRDDTVHC